tara:strand:- start:66 stop:476 length:411 start_codon:yes stop_codon:yes gene_type:complete
MDKELHDKIIEIDQEHIREYYKEDRIVCDICQPNREKGKYYKKNARFIEMDYGVVLSCRRCKQSYPLNKYLEKANKNHELHAIERWEIGTTGWEFNCPHPPQWFNDLLKKSLRNEYKRREEDLKKQNYFKKYGKYP